MMTKSDRVVQTLSHSTPITLALVVVIIGGIVSGVWFGRGVYDRVAANEKMVLSNANQITKVSENLAEVAQIVRELKVEMDRQAKDRIEG